MSSKPPKRAVRKSTSPAKLTIDDSLIKDLRFLIDQARMRIARQVNTELVMLNWRMGKRISDEILRIGKPEYGSQLLEK